MAEPMSPPFAVWDATDHSGPVIIVTTLCCLYWFVACTVQQSFAFARGAVYSWAHSLLAASMVAAFLQSTLVLVASHNGLGKSANVVPPSKLQTARQVYRASNVFYTITLGLVKCSSACFVASLTVKNTNSFGQVPKAQKVMVSIILALAMIWTIGSAIALGLSCSSPSTESCMGTLDRWIGVFVGDAVTDILITAFAGTVILNTKTALKRRFLWFAPFCLRLGVALWAGLRLLSINRADFTHDPTISLWLFIALTQVQVMLALLSASFPGLKQTLQDLVTRYGMATDSQSGSKHDNSFALKKLRSDRSEVHPEDTDKPRLFQFPSSIVEGATRGKPKAEESSTGDGDSQDGIIRHDEFEVRYDHGEASDRDGYSRSW